ERDRPRAGSIDGDLAGDRELLADDEAVAVVGHCLVAQLGVALLHSVELRGGDVHDGEVLPALRDVHGARVGTSGLRSPAVRLVIARCEVNYEGRLTAHLPMAPRLIMVKADG